MSYTSEFLCEQQYANVKRLAHKQIRGERWTHTYHATDLAHDALLRLGFSGQKLWPTVESFISAAAENIRCVLIDRFRRQNAKKRTGKRDQVLIGERQIEIFDHRFNEIEIEEAIERYAVESSSLRASVIRMRLHGYKRQEIINALRISSSDYDSYLKTARKRICLWLLPSSRNLD